MNCCLPLQVGGSAAPAQAGVSKNSELSWSEYVSGFPELISLVTPFTLSNDPVADLMWPATTAEKSIALPTV